MIGEEPSALVQDGDELIDTSTPQSLERDFYAWLKVSVECLVPKES
jgi:hypothetical protein